MVDSGNTSAPDVNMALQMMKTRLNRLPGDTSLDEYLKARLEAAREELERKGITLRGESTNDLMLMVDLAVYNYGNRDKQAGHPDWLRLKIRERWLHERDS